MENQSLVDKVKEICLDEHNFFKGHQAIIGNVKLRYYYNKKKGIERIRIIEGQKRVFDYVKLKKCEVFEWGNGNNWEKVVEEAYSLLNRGF